VSKEPLKAALKQIGEDSQLSIVLDAGIGEKGGTVVTADLANVPIDTAVLVLADQAGLKSVLLDNVLYVTTKEKAKSLQQEYRRRRYLDDELKEEELKAQEQLDRAFRPNGYTKKDLQEFAKDDERRALVRQIRTRIRRLLSQIDELQEELDELMKQ
jgi:transposase